VIFWQRCATIRCERRTRMPRVVIAGVRFGHGRWLWSKQRPHGEFSDRAEANGAGVEQMNVPVVRSAQESECSIGPRRARRLVQRWTVAICRARSGAMWRPGAEGAKRGAPNRACAAAETVNSVATVGQAA